MSSARQRARTPSPPPTLRTPPAPRLGFHDSWEPYSPRKSTRISSQRSSNRIPSPPPSSRQLAGSLPRSPKKKAVIQSEISMVSPVTSPRKRSQAALNPGRQVSGLLTAEGTANAAAALGLDTQLALPTQRPDGASVSQTSGMLPTPTKTPQKPPNEKTVASIQSFARNLFSSEDSVMPSPRKRRSQKYPGAAMEGFTADDEEDKDTIPIFTDSQDRIPEKDNSDANPFFGTSTVSPIKRQSKRKLVNIPGEGAQSVDEAARREDGMVYVFRGKKFFRKFSEQDQTDEQQNSSGEEAEARITRPLTRASIKPRLLFPTQKPTEEEEEALTDIEDMNMVDDVPQTPKKTQSISAKTPEAPKYAPVSPPDTKRTTRSTNKLVDTPMKSTGRKSPFDSWPRTKEHKGRSPAPKRAGETLDTANAKRARS